MFVVTTRSAPLSIRLNSRALFVFVLFSSNEILRLFLTAFYHPSLSDFNSLFPTHFFYCVLSPSSYFFILAQLERRLSRQRIGFIERDTHMKPFGFYCTAWILFHFTELTDIVVCSTAVNFCRSCCRISRGYAKSICIITLRFLLSISLHILKASIIHTFWILAV